MGHIVTGKFIEEAHVGPAMAGASKVVVARTQPVPAASRGAAAAVPKLSVLEGKARADAIMNEVGRTIVGKREVIRLVMANLLAQGNILFEDFPGLAKTVLASTFARATGCDFKRVQFTPDVLPADITGSSVYDQKSGEFQFRRGPVFTNILLADEINRAPPKTQSALLEAMQERQVSIEGQTYKLGSPYLVMATQNPVEQEGTYPLPEAQMDRFLMRLSMGYPNKEDEMEILRRRIGRGKDDFDVAQVAESTAVVAMQRASEGVHVSPPVIDYIAEIVIRTRKHPDLLVGSSPRGSLALLKAGRAMALLNGRDYVTPDDIRAITVPVLAHRMILRPESRIAGTQAERVVGDLVRKVQAPTV
jgi:MoxR-like ATPase